MLDIRKYCGLYCRLSKDDEKAGESASIETQKSLLMQYATENNLLPVEFYIDDGYSGLNFDRPEFQRMIDDIVAGKIHTVITKDLSRMGRDHLGVGHYTEIFFPTQGVRYIAVNDNVDTSSSQSNDFAALKNVINEFYSRDTSRKIKASVQARAKEGKYRSTASPFGYIKDPNDKNHLIPDPETSHYIKQIFELVVQGYGNSRLRGFLRENKVPCPSWFHYIRGEQDKGYMFPTEESRYFWRPDTLRLIIRNRVYMGDCVNGKTTAIFKTKIKKKVPKEDWIIVKDTHEPLVSRELWERANELVSIKRHNAEQNRTGYISPFTGILKCHDCGKALTRRRYGTSSWHQIYVCTTYASYGVGKCSQHKIFEDDLIAAVLGDIRSKAQIALKSKKELIDIILKQGIKTMGQNKELKKKSYNAARKRLVEIERLLARLYEDSIIGKISEDNFDRLMDKYQQEQAALEKEVSEYVEVQSQLTDLRSDAEQCVELLAKHSKIEALTPEIVNTLIRRIEVYEPESAEGVMRQKVDIYYRHVGIVNDCEFDSLTFYHHKKTLNPAQKRRQWKKEEEERKKQAG